MPDVAVRISVSGMCQGRTMSSGITNAPTITPNTNIQKLLASNMLDMMWPPTARRASHGLSRDTAINASTALKRMQQAECNLRMS